MTERWVTLLALLVLAWAIAVPVSWWFARAAWPAREPVAALITWQAIGLSGGLAVLTAELTLAASDTPGRWHSAVTAVLSDPAAAGAVGAVGLALFAVSGVWLLGVLAISFVRAARSRRAHRMLLELLASPDRAHDTTFDVIEASAPVAYSLPGRDPHVVLSTAARNSLSGAELRAVLAHERAHLRQRHTILVQPFIAWERSLPFLAAPRAARRRVEQLVEMVCDDAACRVGPAEVLVSALGRLAPGTADTAERRERLSAGRPDVALRLVLLGGSAVWILAPPAVLVAIR